MSRVLVILPAYNEAESIGEVIGSIRKEAPDYGIVVIDVGSRDETAHVVTQYPGVDLVQLPYNLGIGGAMQTGYKYALR